MQWLDATGIATLRLIEHVRTLAELPGGPGPRAAAVRAADPAGHRPGRQAG